MFVGRKRELAHLEEAYQTQAFRMIVVYGRRRVGKTTLLAEFAKDKRTLFFTAQQQSDQDNLADFSARIAAFFSLPDATSFSSWGSAFDYIANKASEQPFLLVFDEFPYAAQANPSLPSELQIAIDHRLSKTPLCLVLCGSNQGFMENDVLGKKSPLHGRRTSQMRLKPFDYKSAAEMMPGIGAEDAFKYYACVGGTPYYLSQIDPCRTFDDNMTRLFFNPEGFLYEEPLMLLRQELREPALYNSILRAIGTGANRPNEIAGKTGLAATSVTKYLQTLINLGIIERIVPFGENPETSRKGLYRFTDACYDFWYTFVMPVAPDVEGGAGEIVARNVLAGALPAYLGRRFERVCLEWLLSESLAERLPLSASGFGSWWGADPLTKKQTDIDVVTADRFGRRLAIGECKWRESFNETAAIASLKSKAHLVKHYEADFFYLFSKHPASAATKEKALTDVSLRLVCLDDMYC